MRIIGGIYRGRKLKAPRGKKTRPTSDIVRESLFNIIGFKVSRSTFLDAYAGTGAVGIEALSRGASFAVFIDNYHGAINLIKQNLLALDLLDRALVLNEDDLMGFNNLIKRGHSFDIIFIDPPYGQKKIEPCLELLYSSTLLKSDGLVVVQSDMDDLFQHKGFLCLKRRKYGRTVLSFLVRE
jgi:16S rRNA (guanine966-N2)-methyltransferase